MRSSTMTALPARPQPQVPRRRTRRLAAAVAVLAPLGLGHSLPAQASPSAPSLHTVVTGLNNPRHLIAHDGALYIAEAGLGGSGPCAPSPEGGLGCVGRTGDIARISNGQVTRLMTGLSSIAAQGSGFAAAGPADVTFVGNTPVAVVQDQNITTTGANPYGSMGSNLGKMVVGLNAGRGPIVGGPNFAAYEAAHNPDLGAPGNERPIDSDPYAVTSYRGGFAVADAAANDILWVDTHSRIHLLAVLPVNFGTPPGAPPGGVPTQAVPTSVRVGPDGALYVSELSGFAGTAKVMRVVPGEAPTVYADGFDSISDIAFDEHGRLLVLVFQQGGLFGPPAPGALIRVNPATKAHVVLAGAGLEQPTGITVVDDTAYISNHGASPRGGAAGGELLSLHLMD